MVMSINVVVDAHQAQQIVVPILIDLVPEQLDQLLALCVVCGSVDAVEHMVIDRHRYSGNMRRQGGHFHVEKVAFSVDLGIQNR